MRYYKVKKEYDNATRYTWRNKNGLKCIVHPDGILIGGELYTQCERNKIANANYFFEEVEIPKSKIYFFFGARLAEV